MKDGLTPEEDKKKEAPLVSPTGSNGALPTLSNIPSRQMTIQFYPLRFGGQLVSASPVSSALEALLRAEVVVDNGSSDKSELEPSSLASLTCSSRYKAIAAFITSKLQVKSLYERKARGTF